MTGEITRPAEGLVQIYCADYGPRAGRALYDWQAWQENLRAVVANFVRHQGLPRSATVESPLPLLVWPYFSDAAQVWVAWLDEHLVAWELPLVEYLRIKNLGEKGAGKGPGNEEGLTA